MIGYYWKWSFRHRGKFSFLIYMQLIGASLWSMLMKKSWRSSTIGNVRARRKTNKKNIDRYVTLCITKGIRNILTENDWNFVWFQSDRPFQHDGINCGLHVIYYMDTIGKNNRFNYHFNPDSYRLELAKILIINSEEMNSVCPFCFSNRNADKVFCQTYKRFSHYDCLEEFLFVDLCTLCQIYLKR